MADEPVYVTSPEGWREMHMPVEGGVAVYVETAEVDAEGLAVFQFVAVYSRNEPPRG